MMDRALWGAGAVALALAVAASPTARAQEVLHAPEAIRACLCRQQAMGAMAADLSAARQSYQSGEGSLKSLDTAVNAAKQKLDPTDLAGREALAKLLQQRDTAQDHLATVTTPQFNAAVNRYNAAVDAYKDDCAGKSYDQEVLAKVQSNLSCPADMAGTKP